MNLHFIETSSQVYFNLLLLSNNHGMKKISNYLFKGWEILDYLELWFLLLKNTFIIKENTNYVHQHLFLSTYFALKGDMSIFGEDAKSILHTCIDFPLSRSSW